MTSKVSIAYDILKNYNGQNNQIRYYKRLYDGGKLILEQFATDYIIANKDYIPFYVNKIVKITKECGIKFQEKWNLLVPPEKVFIISVIGEMGASYHCYIKTKIAGTQLVYIRKRDILDKLIDVDYMSMDIDFDKFDNMPSNMGRKLYEHQKTGVKFLLSNKKCILADTMGTGKTTTSIIAALAGGFKKILIITTASLKTTWYRDLILYEPKENIQIINGSNWTPGKKFTVMNYDIVQNFYQVAETPVFEIQNVFDKQGNIVDTLTVPVMVKEKSTGKMVQKMQKSRKKEDIQKCLAKSPLFLESYDCVIIDEAQRLSNRGSIRYKTISDFLKKANPKNIYLLTGTPLTNTPMNLFNILSLIDADVTRDYNYFVTRYCSGKEIHLKTGKTIMKMGEPSNLDELREKIKDVYIRRLASETGEMVDKSIIRKYYDLNEEQRERYQVLWNDYLAAQDDDKQEETEQYRQLVEGSLVRQYLAKEMTAHTIELVDDYLEQGEKVVIITCFQEEMDILSNYYGKKCVTYNGKMLPKQKDKAQDLFMNDPKVQVFIGQVIACGVGLSLPIAKTLIFNSYDWVAANNKQAEDRIYRLTQKRDVECIYQLFTDSISQDMFDKVIFKELIASQTIKSETEKESLK